MIHFLLVGNASYLNRGCEAIVRGTMEILRAEFGGDLRVTVGSYMPADVGRAQAENETDPAIRHVRLNIDRFSPGWFLEQANKRLGTRFTGQHLPIAGPLRNAAAALEIGGDNYSLDYGRPVDFLRMDRFIHSRRVPLVLWGASVGPFDKDPEFAPQMYAHLRTFAGLFLRESFSIEYLKRNGVEANVRCVADPAFAMRPAQPPPSKFNGVIRPGTIGMNFSPLMADYVTGGNHALWFRTCVQAVSCVARGTDRDLLLVPHVVIKTKVNDDPGFLQAVAAEVRKQTGRDIPVLGSELTAAELKWVISRLEVFAGARTHATIAALSSAVPTLSLAYSVKAKGLNQDLFGSQEFCLSPEQLAPEQIAGSILSLARKAPEVRRHLARVVPNFVQLAFQAGKYLREAMARRDAA